MCREQEDEISRLEEEIQTSNDELLRLKEEIGSKQQIITNAKISQSMRLAQISRLSGLSQPIELDHTYFFVDRFPHSNSSSDQRNHPSSTSVSSNPQRTAPISLYKTENLQKLGIMKTGEGVLLEGRLNEITKLLEGHIFSFSSIASTINLNPDNHVYNTPETVQLREQVEKNLREYEKSEERSSIISLHSSHSHLYPAFTTQSVGNRCGNIDLTTPND